MRSEGEMMNLILAVARQDERIRAVALNGSRANPRVPKDWLQDYDIVYVVTDVDSFAQNREWIDVFGERMILQIPIEMRLVTPGQDQRQNYLMQFMDGNRIDLTLVPLAEREDYCREDSLTVVLLDKDGCLPELPESSDSDYWAKPPTGKLFADCCNEFWWLNPYVAKGLWRQEILYAKRCLDLVREMLAQMLEWRVGMEHDFAISIGKCGKYLQRYLPGADWQELLATFSAGSYAATWESLFAANRLFRRTAQAVAQRFGYDYPAEDDRRVSEYVQRICELPADAQRLD